jgi:nicotinamide-nucleotide adenylyltransferase
MKLGIAGLIGRFKPLHNGGKVLLETVCENAEHVIIGIGSANQYNMRNPFTADETAGMINAVLEKKFSNYEIVKLDDKFDENKWTEQVKQTYKTLDCFVSGNDYVGKLLSPVYKIVTPDDIIPAEEQIMVRATEVRIELAKAGNWKEYVPDEVAEYIVRNKLDERFRHEFGLETLAKAALGNYVSPRTEEEEKHQMYV